jgi:hypothetical protein
MGNKLTLLGFFGVLPGVQLLIADLSLPSRLLFLFGVSGVDGPFTAACQVVDPEGEIHFESAVSGEFDATKRAILGTGFVGPLKREGDFRVLLLVDEKSIYESAFDVRQGIQP